MKTITASNSVLILTVEELYPSGVEIQKFAADAAFASSDVTLAETRMGVDGKIAAGYTPSIVPLNISLEADSDSYEVMLNILERQQRNQTCYKVTAQITIPALGKEFTFETGVLKVGHPMPDAKKVLEPTTWSFDFESMHSSTI